jgi:protein TonB
MRRSLIAGSLIVHGGIALALVIAGVWRIDRLEASRPDFDLRVSPPVAALEGGPVSGTPQKVTLKPHRPRPDEVVQPARPPDHPPEDVQTTGGGGGSGSGSGSGTNPIGPVDGCTTPPCGETTTTPPPKPKHEEPVHVDPPTTLSPSELRTIRTSGDEHITPSELDRTAMVRDGRDRLIGSFKVCVSTAGVPEPLMLRSTGYADYDRRLVDGIRTWRYRPFMVGGRAVPVCAAVTFIYTIK